ncbi:hypothetical protein SprV_0401602600 [Sparganum proliferum]
MASDATPRKSTGNKLAQHLEELPVSDDVIMETRWRELRNAIQSIVLGMLESARCEHPYWFYDNDADISQLLTEKPRLHNTHMNHRNDVSKAAFFPVAASLMFSVMLMNAHSDQRPGIHIAYRTDAHLLNSKPMQALTRSPLITAHALLFARDCALNTVTDGDMQRSMDLFASGCAGYGLTISIDKTMVMHQLSPNAASRIHVNGTPTEYRG